MSRSCPRMHSCAFMVDTCSLSESHLLAPSQLPLSPEDKSSYSNFFPAKPSSPISFRQTIFCKINGFHRPSLPTQKAGDPARERAHHGNPTLHPLRLQGLQQAPRLVGARHRRCLWHRPRRLLLLRRGGRHCRLHLCQVPRGQGGQRHPPNARAEQGRRRPHLHPYRSGLRRELQEGSRRGGERVWPHRRDCQQRRAAEQYEAMSVEEISEERLDTL